VPGRVGTLAAGDPRRGGGGQDESQACGTESVHALRSSEVRGFYRDDRLLRQILSVSRLLRARVWRSAMPPSAQVLDTTRSGFRDGAGTTLDTPLGQEECRRGSFRHSGKGGIGRFPPCFCAGFPSGALEAPQPTPLASTLVKRGLSGLDEPQQGPQVS